MTSRERLLAVLEGKLPDRVPVSTYELVGYNSQSFENKESSYHRLMETIRKETDCICMWNPGSNETLLMSSAPVDIQINELKDEEYIIWDQTLHTPQGDLHRITKYTPSVQTVWQPEHWCKSSEDVDKVLSVPFEPLVFDVSDVARINQEVGNNGIIMPSLADPMYLAADLMEFGDFTVWAMTEKEHFARTVEIMHERVMENLRRMLDVHVADLYRICGPEYACPPFLHPDYFRQFVTPYVKEMTDLIHARGAKVRLHCHGRIGRVLDYIVETGCDALDPCEGPPDGDISLAEIKSRIGDRVSLFGNIQLKLLEAGTEEEVRQEVRRCMEAAKEGGRFVLMPTAAPINIPLESKTESNYLAYIDEALQWGKY